PPTPAPDRGRNHSPLVWVARTHPPFASETLGHAVSLPRCAESCEREGAHRNKVWPRRAPAAPSGARRPPGHTTRQARALGRHWARVGHAPTCVAIPCTAGWCWGSTVIGNTGAATASSRALRAFMTARGEAMPGHGHGLLFQDHSRR